MTASFPGLQDDPRALRQMLQMALKRGTKGDIQEKVDIHTDIALSIQNKLSDELAEAYNVVSLSPECIAPVVIAVT